MKNVLLHMKTNRAIAVAHTQELHMNMKRVFAAAVITLAAAMPARAADKDIVDTAVGAGDFTTLAAALEAADLVTTLKGSGPFTVFAPTDEAFSKLPAGTVETLLKPENKQQLVDILSYHVVPGKVMAADVVSLDEAPTVNGYKLSISAEGNGVKVNDANVTATDIDASNGVIHVVDQVILPPQQ